MSIDWGVINELARRLRKVRPPSYETRKIAADALDGLMNRIKELDALLERHPNWAMIEAAADDVRRAATRAERERCLKEIDKAWVERCLHYQHGEAHAMCDDIRQRIEEGE